MRLRKMLLTLGLLAMPTVLTAQWAHYADAGGWTHSLLAAPGGGWVVAGTGDIFKLSNAGQVLWGQRFTGGPPYASCRRAWSTPDGGYLAAVDYNFGGTATLFKLSASGGVVWQKTYTLANAALDVFCPTHDGGAIMAGRFDTDLLVCGCSSDGEIVWQRSYGTGLIEWATAAAETSDGGILVLGQCAPPETGIADDIWVLKLAATGEVEWQKRIGGAAMDLGEQVFQTADGGYLIAGHSASFATDGRSLFWLLKLSPAGIVERQLTLDHPYGGRMWPAAGGPFLALFSAPPPDSLTAQGQIVIVLIAQDGAIVRETPYPSTVYSLGAEAAIQTQGGGWLLAVGEDDAHVLKLESSGRVEWKNIYGSAYSPDKISALSLAPDGGYVMAGTTSSLGGSQNATWIMKTAADGSINTNCYFIEHAIVGPSDEPGTSKEVAATVADTDAVTQNTWLVASAADIPFTPWGPAALPALGKPTSTLKIGVTTGAGTTSPSAGSHTYATGTEVQISVAPKTDYLFNGWSGNVSVYQSSFSIVMDGDKEIMAGLSYDGPPGPIEEWVAKHCVIASAAYGDPSHPDVKMLREFRDHYLMKSPLGRSLVDLYYRYSPLMARFVEKHPALKAVSRTALYPAVALGYVLELFN
jgi:hypothetical protein